MGSRPTRALSFSALSFVFVAAVLATSLSPAAAATARQLPGTATGVAGPILNDGTCPMNPEFPNILEPHQHFHAAIATDHGPDAVLDVDVCHVFSGAMGGIDIEGSFVLAAPQGTLRGAARGVIGNGAAEFLGLTLTIVSGTRGLAHSGGQLFFQGCFPSFDGPLSNATLTLTTPPPVTCS